MADNLPPSPSPPPPPPPPPPPQEKKLDSFKQTSVSRRKRTVFTKEQLHVLISYFEKNPYPGIKEREELAARLNTDESRIQVWFQNRRVRQLQKHASPASTCSGKQIKPENPSPSEIPEDSLSENGLSSLDTSRSPSWPDELSQGASPRTSCSIGRRNAVSTTEPACSYEYSISQSHHLDSSQTTRLSTPLQPCVFPRPISQGNSSQWASSWALQGAEGPENHGTHTSFCGAVKPPLHDQQQDWAMRWWYSSNHPPPFQTTQVPIPQLQQRHPQQPPALLPSVLQPPTSQVQQFTSSLPWPKGEEQPCELLPSFNQKTQLQPSNLSNVGLGSTMPLPDDVTATLRDLIFPQEHLDVPLGHLPAAQGHLGDHLDLAASQGPLDLPLEDLVDLLEDLAETPHPKTQN